MSNIFQAARQGKLARVEEILAQGGVDLASLDAHGYTALSYAAMSQNPVYLDVSKTLIRAGAPLNVPGERESPLHAAMLYKNYEVAALLVKSGAEVNVRDYLGNTPLKFAPDRSMAALLIAASADVNAAPVAKRTGPLHFAASSGNLGVIRELLSHPDIEGVIECVAALLEAGADPCATNSHGKTPLQCIVGGMWLQKRYCRIAALLVAAGDRSWLAIPFPCPTLETTLLVVWKNAPEDLPHLFFRLEPKVQRRIRAALCTLHCGSPRHLLEHTRMRLLHEAFGN